MPISRTVSRGLLWVTLLAATTGLIVSAAQGDSKPAWKKFELSDRRLSVLMPGTPETKDIHYKSFIGDITTHQYSVTSGRDSYLVDFADLPGFAVAFAGKKSIYDHAKGALLKVTLSKSISFSDITLNGIKGKKLVYDTPSKPGHPEMQGEARFFLVGDRLYSADAVVEMDGGDEKLRHFFSSLEIRK